MKKKPLLSIVFNIRIILLVLILLMQSCERTGPLNENDASPERKELSRFGYEHESLTRF